MNKTAAKKFFIKLTTLVFIIALIPAIAGMTNLVSGEVVNGKCLTEIEEQEYHRTQGVAKYKSAVIFDGEKSFVMKNMTCAEFKNPVNPFRYEHPYWSTYSICVIGVEAAVIFGLIFATIASWLDKLISRRKREGAK